MRHAIRRRENKGNARKALLGLGVLALFFIVLWHLFGRDGISVFRSVPEGAINGLFTINEAGEQVFFSKGNLQYQASSNTWRFAEKQWDYIGEMNSLASSNYDGWIDLFSWGSSGFDHGANCYQPWDMGGQFDHAAYHHNDYDLSDETGKADWGYNAISNGGSQEMTWRTLRSSEWVYLLKTRNTATSMRYAKAKVNGVNGLVLLPDNWDTNVYDINQANQGNAPYGSNVISSEDWTSAMEANGAVFLPATENVQDGSIDRKNYRGVYWSATSDVENAWLKSLFDFSDNYVHAVGGYYSFKRYPVRLVCSSRSSSSIEAVPQPFEGGIVTGQGTRQNGQICTLSAVPSTGYVFMHWVENGKIVSFSNPFSFAVGFNRNLKAVFDEESCFPLVYSYDEPALRASVVGLVEGQRTTGDIVIPEQVNHFGNIYSVRFIGDCAFIASQIRSVELPSSLLGIGEYALYECPSLASITIRVEVPPVLGQQAFGGVDKSIPVYIPQGSLFAYQNAEGWNLFTNFIEIP